MLISSIWHISPTGVSKVVSSTQTLLSYLHVLKIFNAHPTKSSIVWSNIRNLELRRLGWSSARTYSKLKLPTNSDSIFSEHKTSERVMTPYGLVKLEAELWPLFLQAWSVMRPKGTSHYTTHRDFKLFFLTSAPDSGHSPLVSAKGYFARWASSYNFLFNLFYSDSSAQLLSSKFFIEESLIFNWENGSKNYKLFRFVQPIFLFSDLPHGEFIHSAVFSIFVRNLDFAVVVDLKTHNILLKYLRRYNLYIIALVPINYSPWTVSYPIPSFADSRLAQYHFLKLTLHIKMEAKATRYGELFRSVA